ncbi:hypothetical protein NCAS_0G03670 [Naumovozyma castellii]|uniref:ferroxidase n=1 Tax=Naumovozyma castellii TaxID=27288 RepID=G0VHE8_NAUCA|nr:hypothetical protein NCAS_0G03670 [Naumovozyma castellii CBS 4309]CCC71254.1 hypothetical protein NCAS_0G03670 [Naumovozyma castellii CBS 4309]
MFKGSLQKILRSTALRATMIRVPLRTIFPKSPTVHKYLRTYFSVRNYSITTTKGDVIPDEVIDLPLQIYHSESDLFLENLMDKLELLSETDPDKWGTELELSHGVLTIDIPSLGTYIINKQPSNKQIWMSSPVSGPNRFDYYHKKWISLRDNEHLIDIINREFSGLIPAGHSL